MAIQSNNWQEWVPFYVAGTLSPEERQAFERILATLPEARQAVEEWRIIAHVTYQEAHTRAQQLPPLSRQVRAQLPSPHVAQNGHHPRANLDATLPTYLAPAAEYVERPHAAAHPAPRKTSLNVFNLAMMAAAAVVLVICMGSLAIFALSSNGDKADEPFGAAMVDKTNTPLATSAIEATRTTVLLATPTQGLFGSPIATESPVNPPTLRPQSGGGVDVATLPAIVPTNTIVSSVNTTGRTLGTPTALPTDPAPEDQSLSSTLSLSSPITLNERVSYPEGDQIDELIVTLPAGVSAADFNFQLSCVGVGTENLQWTFDTQTFYACTSAPVFKTIEQGQEIHVYVAIRPDSSASSVFYSLYVTPIGLDIATLPPAVAPADEDIIIANVPVIPTQFSQTISSPTGDLIDNWELGLQYPDMGNEYQYQITLICTGINTANLIWATGLERKTLYCGDSVSGDLFKEVNNYKLPINVLFNDNTQNSYLSYTLIVVPTYINPNPVYDSEPKEFIVTRTGNNTFSDRITSPNADWIDRINMTVADITPGEIRNLQITLICTGTGTELVSWTTVVGGKQNGCGSTLYAGLSDQNKQITFDITFPEGSTATADVSYTLQVVEGTAP